MASLIGGRTFRDWEGSATEAERPVFADRALQIVAENKIRAVIETRKFT